VLRRGLPARGDVRVLRGSLLCSGRVSAGARMSAKGWAIGAGETDLRDMQTVGKEVDLKSATRLVVRT
jgi:hypothetical protein